MGRRLERHVDWDLVERIEASGPIKKSAPVKGFKEPREGHTYRQNGRVPKANVKARPFRGRIDLNRSGRWPHATSYVRAREIGPSSATVR